MSDQIISSELPDEFIRRIESDLNKIAGAIPDFFSKIYDEIKIHWNYPNVSEFLVGWCVGSCQASYIQAYFQIYGKVPTEKQVIEIRRTISRRKSQIEHSVLAFIEEL